MSETKDSIATEGPIVDEELGQALSRAAILALARKGKSDGYIEFGVRIYPSKAYGTGKGYEVQVRG